MSKLFLVVSIISLLFSIFISSQVKEGFTQCGGNSNYIKTDVSLSIFPEYLAQLFLTPPSSTDTNYPNSYQSGCAQIPSKRFIPVDTLLISFIAFALLVKSKIKFSKFIYLLKKLKPPNPASLQPQSQPILNSISAVSKQNVIEPSSIAPLETNGFISQLKFKFIFQKVIIGFLAFVAWGTATNWVLLRFFSGSSVKILDAKLAGLGGIGLLFTFGIGGIVGTLISVSSFSLFLYHKGFKKWLISDVVSFFIAILLGFLIIFPAFYTPLKSLIAEPYVIYPRYESFLPIPPSLLFVSVLYLLPIFLGYAFLYKKWLYEFIGLVLILASAAYFIISYQTFDTESQKRSGELTRVNADKKALNFQIYKPTYLPQDLQIIKENTRSLDNFYILELQPFGVVSNSIIETPKDLEISYRYFDTHLPDGKVAMINGVAGKIVYLNCSNQLCSQVLEWVHMDTRIGIELNYYESNRNPLDEQELIKIAESMVPVNTEKISK